MDLEEVITRPIEPADNVAVANLVRSVLVEFGCVGPGFASSDAELDDMTAAYADPTAAFYVLQPRHGPILGCGGFARLLGSATQERVAELRKMYFMPELRGGGHGRRLLQRLLDEMRNVDFAKVYLETTTQMHAAQALYRKFGFESVESPWGNTGHSSCDKFFALDLTP